MPDEGRKDGEEEAHAAVGAHPGHARPAAGDWSVHSRHWSLQVEQAEVRQPRAWIEVHGAAVYLPVVSCGESRSLLSSDLSMMH